MDFQIGLLITAWKMPEFCALGISLVEVLRWMQPGVYSANFDLLESQYAEAPSENSHVVPVFQGSGFGEDVFDGSEGLQ